MTIWALEMIERRKDRRGAEILLEKLQEQDDFLGGRIIEDDDEIRVQAFLPDDPDVDDLDLPDGLRRVAVPKALQGMLNFPQQTETSAPPRPRPRAKHGLAGEWEPSDWFRRAN